MPPEDAEAAVFAAARARSKLSQAEIEPWTGPVPEDMDTRLVHHLPPPVSPSGLPADPRVEQWRAAFRPGSYFYRTGPQFVLVKDTREPDRAARIRVDQEPLVDALLLCEQPVWLAGQDAAARPALEFLLSRGLLLRISGFVLTAPYRMRRWPVPSRLGT